MLEAGLATLFLGILAGGSAIGMWLQDRLQEHHRSRETTESIRMVIAMVVTFAALVLGLLVTSVKADFDNHTDIYRRYGISLAELNRKLLDYGPQAESIRQKLRSFTAAVLADTWQTEQPPPGVYPTHLHIVVPGSDESAELTSILADIDDQIQHLPAADTLHEKISAILQYDIRQVEAQRWALVERSHSRLSPIFMSILMFWLFIVFVIFGVVSPRNTLMIFVISLSAVSVASSLYLILDLDTSVGGFITVSSQPLRDALWHMDHKPDPHQP
jgi:hypothetical protein